MDRKLPIDHVVVEIVVFFRDPGQSGLERICSHTFFSKIYDLLLSRYCVMLAF